MTVESATTTTQQATCDLQGGVHIAAQVGIVTGRLESDRATDGITYTNLQPEIDPPGTNSGPYNLYGSYGYTDGAPGAGGTVSIYGKGFGPVGSTVEVLIKSSTTGATVFTCSGATQVTDANHGIVTCSMEAGYGLGYQLYVAVYSGTNKLETVASCNTGACTTNIDGGYTGCDTVCFKFQGPTVTSVTDCPTSGGTVTLTGTNFGPAVDGASTHVTSLELNANEATNLTVISDTQMTADYAFPGTGRDKSLKILIGGQTYPDDVGATANLFSYAPPTITAFTTIPAWNTVSGSTDTLVFTGTNFGNAAASNTIDVAGTACTPVPASSTHTTTTCTLTCATPCASSVARTVTITVDGQTASLANLYLTGPTIVSGGSISMFGSDVSVNTLTITGVNFGQSSAATGQVVQVETCKFALTSMCTSGDWVVQTGAAHVTSSPATQITTDVAPAFGTNYSVRALFSGGSGASLVQEYTTGGDGVLNFLNPILYNGTDGYPITGAERSSWAFPTTIDTTNTLHKMTVTGQYFGSTANNRIDSIVWDSDPSLLTLANSQWSVDTQPTLAGDTVTLSFYPPSGVGTSTFSVYFTCDGTQTCLVPTNYVSITRDPPTVTGVTSVGTAGGTVTITGTNFGPVGSTNVDSVLFTGGTGTNAISENCTSATVTVADTQITCTVGAGVGYALTPVVTIAGIVSESATGFLNYDGPTVTSVTSPTTGSFGWNSTGPVITTADGTVIDKSNIVEGIWITITGNNFGPVGVFYSTYTLLGQNSSASVTIGNSLVCAEAHVTVYNTEIQCLLQNEGAGAGYNVYFMILGQDSFGSAAGSSYVGNGGGGVGAFSFQPPTVTSANSVSFLGGDVITLTGTNFGPSLASLSTGIFLPETWNTGATTPIVQLTLGGVAALSCNVTISHLEVQCVAPEYSGQSTLTGLTALLNIEGQTWTGTYSFEGPSITSVSTVSFFGGPVTVTGTNFGSDAANIESIIVGGEVQDLTVASPSITVSNTEIVFTAEASTIGEAKDIIITIKGVTTGTSGDGKVLFQGPQVYSATGGDTAGGIVTITGANFGPAGSANIQQVSIADTVCEGATVTSTTTITCQVGPGSGLGYDISVKVGGVVGIGTGVYSYGKPIATGIDPINPPSNTRVVLTGSNFGQYQTLISVTISGLPCTDVVLEVPHTSISCITPDDTGGDHSLLITVDGVVSDSGTYTYAYPDIHNVTSISPSGGNITIWGANFGPVGSINFPTTSPGVKVGQSECYFPYVQQYGVKISCVLPEALTFTNGGLWQPEDLCCDGLMTVNVTIDGLEGSTPDVFQFQNAELHRFEPVTGRSGDQMTIYGQYLGISRAQLNITVDGREVTRYFAFQSNSVGVEIPPGAGGNLTVRIYVVDREATYEFMEHDNNFTYLGPTFNTPRQSEPANTTGGLTTIAGNNLGPLGRSDHIDWIYLHNPFTGVTMECTDPIVTVDDLGVTCTVPAGIGANWDVSMSILGQLDDGSGAGVWNYMAPHVTRVSPRFAAPGTTIFVEGTNFGVNDTYLNVSIVGPGDSDVCMGVVCTESRLSIPHVQVVCVVPESAGALLDVVVEVAGLMSNTSALSDFSYPNPIVRSVTPAPTQGGIITITGQGFGPGGECYKPYIDSVMIGNELCTDAEVQNDRQMTCAAQPGIGSGYDLVVTLRGSSSANTGFGIFQYAHPNVTYVQPPPTEGGTLVIRGENFGVETPNGVEGPTVRVWSEEIRPVFGRDEIVIVEKTVTSCLVTTSHTEIRCLVSDGVGKGYNVEVSVAGLSSLETGLGKMNYAIPIVDSVTPQMENTNGPTTITVVGRNFGTTANVAEIKVFVDTYEVDATTIRMWEIGTFDYSYELTFTAPSGAGINLPIYVSIAGQINEPTGVNDWFSYTAPAVLSVTPVPSQGGIATITGVNFGPLNTPVSSVMLGERPCTDARVTQTDVEIQCSAAPGVGANLDVRLKINADAGSDSLDSGAGKFRYRCPSVTGVSYEQPPYLCEGGRCQAGPTGQKLTIYGNNFGDDIGNITVGLLAPETTEEDLLNQNYQLWDLLDLQFHPDAPLQPNANGLYTLQGGVPIGYARDRFVVVRVFNQDNLQMCEEPVDVRELIETPGKFSSMMFSYAQPDILTTSSAPTAGGRITIYGRGFGPVGAPGVSRVLVEDWRQPAQQLDCQNFNVTKSNVELECDLGAGEGGQLNIWMMVGGQQSGLVRAYSYQRPQLRSVNPTAVAPGTFVTILGENLGNDPSLLAVEMYSDRGEYITTVRPENVTMASPHTQILFPIPVAAGRQRAFVIKLPAPQGVAVAPRNVLSSGDDPSSELFFNFFPPEILSVSDAPTAGGLVTITGTGFGSAADNALSVQTILLGSAVCAEANVTIDDVEIECIMGPGSGGGYDAFVQVSGQDSEFLFKAFSYAQPRVDAIVPAVASGGARITIVGNNFGIDARDISVQLGGQECRGVLVQDLHTSLTCEVPAGFSGRDVEVLVTVLGVENNASATQAPSFTYSNLGCTVERADNFQETATEDDGSCIIPGCMDRLASNFDPLANVPDDSCMRNPVLIIIELALPYPEYLLDTIYYDALILEDVRTNLGLEDAERLNITQVLEGSTIWYIQILDDPEAAGQRNDELGRLLEAKVLNNTWTNSLELGPLRTVELNIDGEVKGINGKEVEPRVSAGSIAAIAVGALVLILWAVFWRQILRWCARRCGSGAEEVEQFLEQSLTANTLYKDPPSQHHIHGMVGKATTRAPARLTMQAPSSRALPYGNQIAAHPPQ